MLMNEKPELVTHGTSQRLIIGNETCENYGEDHGSLFLLTPSSEDDTRNDMPNFHIDLIYGEKCPRVTQKGHGKNSQAIVTTRDKEGYKNASRSIWRIYQSLV